MCRRHCHTNSWRHRLHGLSCWELCFRSGKLSLLTLSRRFKPISRRGWRMFFLLSGHLCRLLCFRWGDHMHEVQPGLLLEQWSNSMCCLCSWPLQSPRWCEWVYELRFGQLCDWSSHFVHPLSARIVSTQQNAIPVHFLCARNLLFGFRSHSMQCLCRGKLCPVNWSVDLHAL